MDPAVGAVCRAVRQALAELPDGSRAAPLLVAWSGGADSTALLAAARHVAPGRVHVAVVDHGLQDGSAQRSAALVARLAAQGVPAAVHPSSSTARAGRRPPPAGPGTPRCAPPARIADSAVLLGHTLDDQAESVLLGLGRGSGPRSLAGMRAVGPAVAAPPAAACAAPRPRAACAAQGLPVWDDPHNADPRFTRVRLRREVLPLLEDVLAGGVAEALARTAAQLRDDGEALDAAAADLLARAVVVDRRCRDAEHGLSERGTRGEGGTAEPEPTEALDVVVLAAAPAAVRRRALRTWLGAHGVGGLTDRHLRAADDLVARWRGQGAVALPRRLELVREHGRLRVRTAAWPRAR